MKKFITLAIILATTVSYADEDSDLQAKRLAWAKAYFEKQGSPAPDGGVKIIPEKQMRSYAEKKEERARFKQDIQSLGYIKSTNPATDNLLTLAITSKNQLQAHGNDTDPEDTHLKRSLNDIRMAYTPTDVSSIADTYIGAAPYLTYLKGQGWVGAIQFFTSNGIGNCSYSENNIKLSHGSIIIAEEDVKKDVNGKVSTIEIMGTSNSGFSYTIEWYDDLFFRTLQCANMNYSTDITEKLIKLANKIDSSSPG